MAKRTKATPAMAPSASEPSMKEQLQELGDLAIKLGEARREVSDWVAKQTNGLLPYDSPGWTDQAFAVEKFYTKLRIVTDTLRAIKRPE
jgi:hypothetical protein